MNQQIDINEVLKALKEQIGEQAQQIAILRATIAMKEKPVE
jgi:hypothetical protein